MLTVEATSEMLAEWKRNFEAHHSSMKPNRKTGYEVDRYFRGKYAYQIFDNDAFKKIVALNITENEFLRNKLPKDELPNIQSYSTGNALVGIDLCTGEFHIESENMEEAAPIYDDLFVYRGLDSADLENFVLVGQYLELTKS